MLVGCRNPLPLPYGVYTPSQADPLIRFNRNDPSTPYPGGGCYGLFMALRMYMHLASSPLVGVYFYCEEEHNP